MTAPSVVLDTNVFVAAGFNPGSHSARLVQAVRDGRLRMVWNHATRDEIEHVMRQIPRLSWPEIADLFRSEDLFDRPTHPEEFGFVRDPSDRKFAALAESAQAPLVTSDAGLLNSSRQMAVPVVKPSVVAADLPGSGGSRLGRWRSHPLAHGLVLTQEGVEVGELLVGGRQSPGSPPRLSAAEGPDHPDDRQHDDDGEK
jgi:uncharacterized protein